jgi:hypothetical protein
VLRRFGSVSSRKRLSKLAIFCSQTNRRIGASKSNAIHSHRYFGTSTSRLKPASLLPGRQRNIRAFSSYHRAHHTVQHAKDVFFVRYLAEPIR